MTKKILSLASKRKEIKQIANPAWRVATRKSRLKMGNNITPAVGGCYRSDQERIDHRRLLMFEKLGLISDLKREVSFPMNILNKHKAITKLGTYKADFSFIVTNDKKAIECIWETKGYETEVYKLKRKIIMHLYPSVHFYESKVTGVTLLNAPESENFLIKKQRRG